MPERRVAVVTGSSRGIGRGIALGLGEAGWTVYVTGRTVRDGDSDRPGSLTASAAEVTQLGGEGVAVRCDHRLDAETQAVFDRVLEERGRLDLLVNNATSYTTDIGRPRTLRSGSCRSTSGTRCMPSACAPTTSPASAPFGS